MSKEARVDAIYEMVQANYKLCPDIIYCGITGKAIGSLHNREWWELAESLSGTVEEAADDLAMRCLASMRPSMRWNRMRMETLDEMRIAAPVETMAFLLNRLFESTDIARTLAQQLERIQLYELLAHQWDVAKQSDEAGSLGDYTNRLLLMLLEIEAKLGLRSESPPITCKQAMAMQGHDFFVTLAKSLTQWHATRVAFHLKEEREARYFAANPGARRAYARQWFESAPKSAETLKREAKQSDINFFDSLFDELTNPASAMHKPAAQRPTAEQVESANAPSSYKRANTKMPKWGSKAADNG